jgi:glutaredoxin-related protein
MLPPEWSGSHKNLGLFSNAFSVYVAEKCREAGGPGLTLRVADGCPRFAPAYLSRIRYQYGYISETVSGYRLPQFIGRRTALEIPPQHRTDNNRKDTFLGILVLLAQG